MSRWFNRQRKDLPPRRKVYVIPLKNGRWRVCRMSDSRRTRWIRLWRAWFDNKGCRLAISPEMWVE